MAGKGSSESPRYLHNSSPLTTVSHQSICSRPVCCWGLAHTSLLPTVAAAGFSPVLSGWVKSSAWYQQKATGGSWGGSFCLLERDIRWRNRTLILVSEDGEASGKTDAVFLLRNAVKPISSRGVFLCLTSKEPCSILRCWLAEREWEMVMQLVWDYHRVPHHMEPLMIIKHKSINRLLVSARLSQTWPSGAESY